MALSAENICLLRLSASAMKAVRVNGNFVAVAQGNKGKDAKLLQRVLRIYGLQRSLAVTNLH